MKLTNLIKYKKRNKTIGRGIGSGHGKQSGRGTKGQKARAGKRLRANFEGGQTPLIQRLPKYRGFTPIRNLEVQIVSVSALAKLKEKTVTKEVLLKHGIIQSAKLPVKMLGGGTLEKAFEVQLERASKSALDLITKAGGSFTSTLKKHE